MRLNRSHSFSYLLSIATGEAKAELAPNFAVCRGNVSPMEGESWRLYHRVSVLHGGPHICLTGLWSPLALHSIHFISGEWEGGREGGSEV